MGTTQCPKCTAIAWRIKDGNALGASIVLILAGLAGATAIIAGLLIGQPLVAVAGLGLVAVAFLWFVRLRFVYECRKCGQLVRMNPFGVH